MITAGTIVSLLLGWIGVEVAGTAIPGIITLVAKLMPVFRGAVTAGKAAHATGVDKKALELLHKAVTGTGLTDEEKKVAADHVARTRANPLDFG